MVHQTTTATARATATATGGARPPSLPLYSTRQGASQALAALFAACETVLPPDVRRHIRQVVFTASCSKGDGVVFPCPLREQETAAAIKALEACMVAAIADLQCRPRSRAIGVDMAKVSCFLMSAYMTSLDGMTKTDPSVKEKLIDTDLNQAQSILYRRLSAGMYETKRQGEFYHIHGSLEASRTLNMIGLPAFRSDLTEYRECIETIENRVRRFTVSELEAMNHRARQAGAPVLKRVDFLNTAHGQALSTLPPYTLRPGEGTTPPIPFANPGASPVQCLKGIRVLELCRVIAGPTIGRSLAAHGAQVLKVTSPHLPDVPFFQVDVNAGKHTTALHLYNPDDRRTFESLLNSADVVIDGYRPGTLDRLGYGPQALDELARRRGKGIVYVAEDCFGGSGVPGQEPEWARRPGWQQIADCVTGVAWEQGKFMGLDEPVVPPFPMSDYGTGALGCVAALNGLYRRATQGGSWLCRTSLVQYDMFLLSLGAYPKEILDQLAAAHDDDFFELRHHDSVDEVGKRALKSVRRLHPSLFSDDLMEKAWSEGYAAEVSWPQEPIAVDGLRIGPLRATRPNGFDPATWDGWDEEGDIGRGRDISSKAR